MDKENLGKWRSLIFTSGDAPKIRELAKGRDLVFCTGCYDILHSGHAIFFEQCRQNGSVVVVGLGRDSTITKLKGKERPINEEMNRAYLLASMKDVDYVIFNNDEIGEGKIDFEGVIRDLKPATFVLNEDDSGVGAKRKLCEELGIKLVLVKREVPNFLRPTSTTAIIGKSKETKTDK